MDRPVENQTPILGYAVFRKYQNMLVRTHIYATPGRAIAAFGVGNWELKRAGLVRDGASPKELKAARVLHFSKNYEVRAIYAGESV